MYKKILIFVFLCFFVLSSVMLAKEEKGKIVEHLVWADTGVGNLYSLTPDPTVPTPHESPPLLTFHVPGSPKCEVLFFEYWSALMFKWSDFMTRKAFCVLWMRIISDDIPDNIDVKIGFNVLRVLETNNSLDYNLSKHGSMHTRKWIMRRDRTDWWKWDSRYKDTGERVPEEDLLPILNNLIDNGFDVESWAEGGTLGISELHYRNIVVEVTSLSKK